MGLLATNGMGKNGSLNGGEFSLSRYALLISQGRLFCCNLGGPSESGEDVVRGAPSSDRCQFNMSVN